MNHTAWLEFGISAVCFVSFLVGMTMFFYTDYVAMYRQITAMRRLRIRKESMFTMSPLKRHIHQLLFATLKKPMKPELFLGLCFMLFWILTLIGMQSFHPLMSVMIGLIGGLVPYLVLRIRLETHRKKGSLEGEKMVSEFLRQYRICEVNVYEALERTVPLIKDCKICCSLLHRMLLRLRATGNPTEIREITDMFSFSLGTNWSHMFAGCIRTAAERGHNVSLGLEDILLQMRQARSRMEERKRMNNEAMRLTLFLVPLLYLSTVALSVYSLEVPFGRFLKNQLGTPEGMLMLLFIAFLFIVNLTILEAVNNQRMDY